MDAGARCYTKTTASLGVNNLSRGVGGWCAPKSLAGGITPQGPGIFAGALALSLHQITPDFLHPLNLPADCLVAYDPDSVSEAQAENDSESSSGRELNEVHPSPSDFQDVIHNSSMRIAYTDLVPMTRLFSTWLPISEGGQRHLANFIQGWDIPP